MFGAFIVFYTAGIFGATWDMIQNGKGPTPWRILLVLFWPAYFLDKGLTQAPTGPDTRIEKDLAELRVMLFSPEELELRGYRLDGFDKDFMVHLASDGKCVVCRSPQCDGKCHLDVLDGITNRYIKHYQQPQEPEWKCDKCERRVFIKETAHICIPK